MQAGHTSQFGAPYDVTTRIISAVVCVALLAVAAGIPNVYIAVLSLLIMLGAYAYSVRGYAVTEGSIVVRRLAGSVRLPLTQVREARRAGPEDFQGCIRLWGSGGLFGYYGVFRTSKLGRCTWYLTDRKRAVVVRTDAKTALYSPDDVDGFLAAIGVVSPGQVGSYSATAAVPGIVNVRIVAGAIAFLLGLAAVAFAVAGARYAPGPPEYTLTAGSLAIHDKFYPVTLGASSVDVSAIRVVDLTQETGWRPSKKTGGFSNTHYRSGWFRASNGQTMRLYWAGATRVVLLPPKGEDAPVLMEVSEPDGFVRQVREEWR